MIEPAGRVWGVADASYLYVIVSDSHIYIGETGELPPKRWGQHLSTAGTLTGKTMSAGLPLPGTSEILFVGVRCTVIDAIDTMRRKRARRVVEEELHRQFSLDARMAGEDFIIISESPPPSVRFTWAFDPVDVARQIRTHVASECTAWRSSRAV
jgi:hypothetical protein